MTKVSHPAISIVLPSHNELKNLKLLIPQIKHHTHGIPTEIIVVDDASTDGSVEWLKHLKKINPLVKPIFGDKLRGIGFALNRGYREARGDIIVSLDADLSFDPNIIKKLTHEIRLGYDLVVGSRHMPDGYYEAKTPAIKRKKLVSRLVNTTLGLLLPIGISDFSANCRSIKSTLWRKLRLQEKTNLWLIEMIVEAAIMGAKIKQVPVRFKDRRFGVSKLRLGRDILLTGYRILGLIYRFKLRGPTH